MKINKIYLPLLFFSCVALGIVIGGLINYPVAKPSLSKNDYKTKLNKLINFIDNEFTQCLTFFSVKPSPSNTCPKCP